MPEILRYHDLELDPAAGNFEQFKKRSLNMGNANDYGFKGASPENPKIKMSLIGLKIMIWIKNSIFH